MRRILCIITACLMIVALLSGCSLFDKFGKDGLQPASSLAINEEDTKKLSDKMPIQLYFATEDNLKLKLEVRYIDIIEGKKSVNALAGIIVKELIAGPKEKSLKSTIPQGTQLLGAIAIDAGIASVNLSKQFVDKHPGGEAASKMTIYSIVNSLTELNEIQKVKFLVNGKTVDTFKGSYKLSSAFPRTISIISKDVPSAETMKQGVDKKAKASPTPEAKVVLPVSKPTTAPTLKPATPAPKPTTGKTSEKNLIIQTASEDEAIYLESLE